MKKVILGILALFLTFGAVVAQHGGEGKGKVLMVVSNASKSEQTGWPIGFWWAELTHAYWEFTGAGYTVDIVSPEGGKLVADGYSDPEDKSGYSAHDILSLGFKKSEKHMALIQDTKKLSSVNQADYKAVFFVGGQSPMYTFKGNKEVTKFVEDFYQTKKPTAIVCHATCILLDAKLPNGKHIVSGKKWTGFANSEEDFADKAVGMKIQPFRIQDEANKIPKTKFMVKPAFTPYAIEDGNLITGQQQNSGAEAARLVIAQLDKK